MRAVIEKSAAFGSIAAPPSKSVSHRALICAALSRGTSVIHNLSDCGDVKATVGCLRSLGAKVEYISGDAVAVTGTDMSKRTGGVSLDCRESGSTLRFLLPLCLLSDAKTVFCGGGRLMLRPLSVYEKLCRERGLLFESGDGQVAVSGGLKPGEYEIDGGVSSQFVSGLLFCLPLLRGDSRIRVIPPFESRPYIGLTLETLRDFSVGAVWEDENTLFVKGGQRYTAREYTVEGDWSAAAVFEALNAFGGRIKITNLRPDSAQGDRICAEYLRMLESGSPTLSVSDCPDLAPILAACAAAKNGAVLTGTRRLKIKESDRGAAMAKELSKFGCRADIDGDVITVDPVAFHAPEEPLCSHNDHRVVTALCALLTLTGGVIDGAQAVGKSWPGFFDALASLGVKVRLER